jgi:glycosyltransferase involved in cell wall biosynthesis
MIIEEGAERDKLELFAEEPGLRERITRPGFVSHPMSYMRRARLFVLSSAWEGFGNVLVEAMAGFRPGPGGFWRVMSNLVGGFRRLGVEVDLLLPPGDHPDLEPLRGRFRRFVLDAERPSEAVSQLDDYLARADVYVVSSIFEGANNALMEALAPGTPCVSTDCPCGPREILDNGRHGPLVPVADAGALGDTLLETLRTPPDRAELAAGAERFDLLTSARRYLEVLGLAPAGDAMNAPGPPMDGDE